MDKNNYINKDDKYVDKYVGYRIQVFCIPTHKYLPVIVSVNIYLCEIRLPLRDTQAFPL